MVNKELAPGHPGRSGKGKFGNINPIRKGGDAYL
jgi:hypothetical protein